MLSCSVFIDLGLEFLAGTVFECGLSQALIEAVERVKVGNIFGREPRVVETIFHITNWRYQENISCKDGHNKGQNGKDLTEAGDLEEVAKIHRTVQKRS